MKYFFKVDIREPYMGNTIVIGVRVSLDHDRPAPIMVSIFTMQDTVAQELRAITPEEFSKLFND